MISNINRQSAVFAAKRPQAAAAAAPAQEAAAASAAPADGVQISSAQGGFNLSAMMAETAKEAASLEGKLPEHVENEVIVKLKPEFAFAAADGTSAAGGFAE